MKYLIWACQVFMAILLMNCVVSKFSKAVAQSSRSTLSMASIKSARLNREVKLSVICPAEATFRQSMSVLLVFDGQDFPALGMTETVDKYLSSGGDKGVLVVGVHANQDRLLEYGTSSQPDYANRGRRASQTTEFVLDELVPYLKKQYNLSPDREDWAIAGFSLSGLMAIDIAWNHWDVFAKVGVFSGSFWWRQRDLNDDYDERDRIMHNIIRNTSGKPVVDFWLQTGTNDEKDDRDNDGIIDSIDDTLDLIAELERKGYQWGKDIIYVEVKEGEHNPKTWGKVFPDFLKWTLN